MNNYRRMKSLDKIKVEVATEEHLKFVDDINDAIDEASKKRGTGIARRTYEYLSTKMKEGKAVITSYSIHYTKLYEAMFSEVWMVAMFGLIRTVSTPSSFSAFSACEPE